jgi:hypothetical protein
VVSGAEVVLFYEWLSTANSLWLQLATVLGDSFGYLRFLEYVIGVQFFRYFVVTLSCGALASCHLLRNFRFSASFRFFIIGRSSVEVWSFLCGVACHAAMWIALVMFPTASMPISVFMGIIRVICSSSFSEAVPSRFLAV